MFKNNIEDEADFCEAYKAQILNSGTEERESPIGSILIILFLLAMIIALSIFGYNYIMDTKSNSLESQSLVKTISDDELKVTSEVDKPLQLTNQSKADDSKKYVTKLLNELPQSESLDVNSLADKIKIDMSKSEEKNISLNERIRDEKKTVIKSLPLMMNSTESKYIEDLAKLTEEIDKERD